MQRGVALIKHFHHLSAIFGATKEQLLDVPGIGPTHAASIMAVNNPYSGNNELRRPMKSQSGVINCSEIKE
jgi:DNA repair protein RadC